MKMQDIVRRVRDLAGDTQALQFTNGTLTDWVNDAVLDCAEENSLLQKTAATSTVVAQNEYTIPADIYKLHSVNVDGQPLRMMTIQEFKTLNPTGGTESGAPIKGYIWAGKLVLYPTPDRVQVLRIDYIYNPAQAVYSGNDADVAWKDWVPAIPESYHRRLVTYCMAQVAYQDDNQEKGDLLMDQFRSGVVDLKSQSMEDDLYGFISVSPRDSGFTGYTE